jgi:polygalacturonase
MRRFSCIRLVVAGILLVCVKAWSAGPFFNVLDYGARNDGSASATEAIRAAIQAAKAAGGGTVYFPAGRHVTGPIELVSNLVLYIDAGATLRFRATRLPFTRGRQQGIEALTPVPLIGGRNLENVTITGRGVLTSDNAECMKLMPRQRAAGSDPGSANGPNWERLLQSLEIKTPATEEEYLRAAPELRPSFVRAMDSRNVLIEGVHFVGSPMWIIHILYSENVVVRDVIIEAYPGVHADGLRVNRPAENISITNCTVHRAHGAVTLGSETSGWIRNLVAGAIVRSSRAFPGTGTFLSAGPGGLKSLILLEANTLRAARKAVEETKADLWQTQEPATEPEK